MTSCRSSKLNRKKITVVIPVYNEEEAFANNFNVILGHFDALQGVDVDVIIVNDGSSDNTESAVQSFCKTREDVSLIGFTRNFGKEAAMQAGLDKATGDAVIVMDSDLQHPPELVSQMISKWMDGSFIVEANKSSRGRESLLSRIFAKSFYRVFNNLSGLDLRNQSDFKLLDRKVVNAYKAMPEKALFFRGIVKWLGYPATQIHFEVPERSYGGTSSWSRLRLARYSISAITSFSAVPLQFVTMLGLVTFFISIIFGAIAVYDKLSGHALDGFTTVILLLLIIGSILMFSFGLMGMYIARIYEEIKGRPSYVLKSYEHGKERPDPNQ